MTPAAQHELRLLAIASMNYWRSLIGLPAFDLVKYWHEEQLRSHPTIPCIGGC